MTKEELAAFYVYKNPNHISVYSNNINEQTGAQNVRKLANNIMSK